jgi:hypothetical protein
MKEIVLRALRLLQIITGEIVSHRGEENKHQMAPASRFPDRRDFCSNVLLIFIRFSCKVGICFIPLEGGISPNISTDHLIQVT